MDKLFNNFDESFLRWRISVEEENSMIEEEECDGEPLLRTVVRTNYLYHLRQSLRKNLEAMKETSDGIEENSINKVIKGCSALLEEKALRNCMIARLYQRMMSQIIKDVKRATSDGSIYSPLKEFAEHQGKISASPAHSNKETQTDICLNTFDNVLDAHHNQTHTLLGPRNSVSSDFSVDTTRNDADTTRNDAKVVNGTQKTWCVKCSRETLGPCSHSSKSDNSSKILIKSIDANGTDEEYSNNFHDFESENRTESEDDKTAVNNIKTSQAWSADKNDEFQVKLRSPNFVEAVAYWYYVESEINELPPKKRQKLDEYFTRIFGKDHNIDYYFLTDEQKSLTCRKRIAKYVVSELTNYYNKKRIESKDLFKTLAKHITSLLLGKNLYPAPEDIKNSVEEFFSGGRIIKTEDDFYL